MIWRILHWACRLFLGGIFIYAGYSKLENTLQFAVAVEGYQLLSAHLVIWVVKVLPWLEIALGVALFAGITVRYTAGFALVLLAFFTVITSAAFLRGIESDCGCFGVGERISLFTLTRDALFILPALFLIIQPWLERRGKSKTVER